MRAQNLKEFFQLIIAYGFCFYVFGAYSYILFENYNLGDYLLVASKTFALDGSRAYFIVFSIIISAFILAIFRRSILLKKSVQVTKKIVFLYWYLFINGMIIIFGVNDFPYYKLILVFLPIAILGGLILVNLKSKFVAEMIHLTMLLLLLNLHFDLLSYLN